MIKPDRIDIPDAFKSNYLPALDGFRGIAILTVIIGHMLIRTKLEYLALGNIGVQLFFVLSGFLITSLLLKEKIKTGAVSLKNFYIRRALRILPVAYLFLAVLLLLNYLFGLKLSSFSFIAAAFYIKNLPLHYQDNWFNGHFWTLAVEEQFYLIFPFILVYNLKVYLRLVIAIIILVPVLQYVGFHNVGIFYTSSILHKITYLLIYLLSNSTIAILVGSLTAIFMFKSKSVPGKRTGSYLSLGLFLLAIAFRLFGYPIAPSEYLSSLIFSILIAFVLYLTTIKPDFLSAILSARVLVALGVLSYSIYIWQQIFLYKQPWEGTFKYADSVFLNIPFLFIVSYLSYHFFEAKILRFKNRFKKI